MDSIAWILALDAMECKKSLKFLKVSNLYLNFDERNEIKGIENVEVVEMIPEPLWDAYDYNDDEEPMDVWWKVFRLLN